MARVPLVLGPLKLDGAVVKRSGFRWLCVDGQMCRAGQPVAYCNVGLMNVRQPGKAFEAFSQEKADFQAVLVLQADGVINISPESSRGGFLDQLAQYNIWEPSFEIGMLTCKDEALPADAMPTKLVFGAGRRVTEVAEIRAGLLTGWHNRSRAWVAEGDRVERTLLSLGACETTAMIRGQHFSYMEMLNASHVPMQVVLIPDDLLIPCARVVLEQVRRTPEQFAEIAADMTRSLSNGSQPLSPNDWLLAGVFLGALQRSPLTEPNHVLTRHSIQQVTGPDAVVMSLVAEPIRIFRHRRLGYSLCFQEYRFRAMGQAMIEWLNTHFESVMRDAEAIRRDYCELIEEMQKRSNVHFLILNVMSSVGTENVVNYAAFDLPMGETLRSVHCKEKNLMLHDLASEHDISIIDIDAITADWGERKYLPDGVHLSGPVQDEARAEILRCIDERIATTSRKVAVR